MFTDWELANQLFGFQHAAEQVVSPDQAAAWIRDLEQRAAAGRFFSAITVLLVSGRNPDDPLRDTLDVLVGTHSIVAPVSAQSD